MKDKEKIIQISTCSVVENNIRGAFEVVYALTDKGELYCMGLPDGQDVDKCLWVKIPDIEPKNIYKNESR